jgi:hypothetical protein
MTTISSSACCRVAPTACAPALQPAAAARAQGVDAGLANDGALHRAAGGFAVADAGA